jgi:hypothetical protein
MAVAWKKLKSMFSVARRPRVTRLDPFQIGKFNGRRLGHSRDQTSVVKYNRVGVGNVEI